MNLLIKIGKVIRDMSACMSFVNEIICIKSNTKSLVKLAFIEAQYTAELNMNVDFCSA